MILHGSIDGRGEEEILLLPDNAPVDKNDLWHGFEMLCYTNHHREQYYTVERYSWVHGVPIYHERLKTVRGEVITVQELMK